MEKISSDDKKIDDATKERAKVLEKLGSMINLALDEYYPEKNFALVVFNDDGRDQVTCMANTDPESVVKALKRAQETMTEMINEKRTVN